MGLGHPCSMKEKKVHLPHPHPKGGFWDTALGGQPQVLLCFVELPVWLSEMGKRHGAPSGVVMS